MGTFQNNFMKLCSRLSKLVVILNAGVLILMIVVAGWQVVSRYVFYDPVTWSEQMCLLLIVYLVFFGGAICVREHHHLELDFFKNQFSFRCKKMLNILACLFTAFFGGYLSYAGYRLMMETWFYPLPALPIPTAVMYFPLVCSGVMIIIFSVESILFQVYLEE